MYDREEYNCEQERSVFLVPHGFPPMPREGYIPHKEQSIIKGSVILIMLRVY